MGTTTCTATITTTTTTSTTTPSSPSASRLTATLTKSRRAWALASKCSSRLCTAGLLTLAQCHLAVSYRTGAALWASSGQPTFREGGLTGFSCVLQLQAWLNEMLNSHFADMFRYKGILAIRGEDGHQFDVVFQARLGRLC